MCLIRKLRFLFFLFFCLNVFATENETKIDEENKNLFVLSTISPSDILIPLKDRDIFKPFSFNRAIFAGSSGDLYKDSLFIERIRRLRDYLGIGKDFTCLDDTEAMHMEKMIEAGINLVQYTHPHILIAKNPFYEAALQQFTYAAASYIEYRMKGIRQHLATRGIEIRYESFGRISFADHCKQQEIAITSFERRLDIRRIRKNLASIAPALDVREESAEKFLAEPHNSYNDFLMQFSAPPSTDVIATALIALRAITQWKKDDDLAVVAENRVKLQNSIHSLKQVRDYGEIFNYIKLHSYLENISHASLNNATWSNHQKEFWQNQPLGLLMAIGKFVPYRYTEVNENKTKEAYLILENCLIGPEKHIQARRYIQHFFVQWPNLKKLGLLSFHARQLNRLFHSEILLASAHELIPELCDIILPNVESWINFELEVGVMPPFV